MPIDDKEKDTCIQKFYGPYGKVNKCYPKHRQGFFSQIAIHFGLIKEKDKNDIRRCEGIINIKYLQCIKQLPDDYLERDSSYKKRNNN